MPWPWPKRQKNQIQNINKCTIKKKPKVTNERKSTHGRSSFRAYKKLGQLLSPLSPERRFFRWEEADGGCEGSREYAGCPDGKRNVYCHTIIFKLSLFACICRWASISPTASYLTIYAAAPYAHTNRTVENQQYSDVWRINSTHCGESTVLRLVFFSLCLSVKWLAHIFCFGRGRSMVWTDITQRKTVNTTTRKMHDVCSRVCKLYKRLYCWTCKLYIAVSCVLSAASCKPQAISCKLYDTSYKL
jgi:hypothetical protein